MTVRAERVAEARRLRNQGLPQREVGARMGISRTYAAALLSDPDGDADRIRKARSGGTCADCGTQTTYGRAGKGPARRCAACARANPTTRYWTRELVLDALHEWKRRYDKQPTVSDWLAGRNITAEQRRRYYDDNCWPHVETVRHLFGSWSNALRAAGFKPHANSGGRNAPCHGCGCHRDDRTAGCDPCYYRHKGREYRRARNGRRP